VVKRNGGDVPHRGIQYHVSGDTEIIKRVERKLSKCLSSEFPCVDTHTVSRVRKRGDDLVSLGQEEGRKPKKVY